MYFGVDQSLRSSGVAVISAEQKVVTLGTVTPRKLKGVHRLVFIREALRDILDANPNIQYAALEGYSMESVNRSFDLGELGGVVRLVLHDAAIPFLIVPPASLKQFVADHGQAKKEQMRQAVLRKWGHDVAQDDECDALGLAQVARSFHLNKGTTRSELEVLKKLRDTDKKISLVSYTANVVST